MENRCNLRLHWSPSWARPGGWWVSTRTDLLAERNEFELSVPLVRSLDERSNSPGYCVFCRLLGVHRSQDVGYGLRLDRPLVLCAPHIALPYIGDLRSPAVNDPTLGVPHRPAQFFSGLGAAGIRTMNSAPPPSL
jgi:hypothetical protein